MISVQNPRQLLNGSRLLLAFVALCLVACSPKVAQPPKAAKTKLPETKTDKPARRFSQAGIAVFVPFSLDEINLKKPTKAGVDKASLAIDFYQGFLMGIHAASGLGLDFKLNIYDTRDDTAHLSALLKKTAVKEASLIVGPVFPAGLAHIKTYALANKIPVVSPLAASPPADFANPYLISVVNDIDRHAEKMAKYIGKNFATGVVAIINGRSSTENQFASPLKALLRADYPHVTVKEFTSAYALETQMDKGKQYAVVVCSDNPKFVEPTLFKLYRLSKIAGYNINLFGHPNWIKQSYNIERLQALKTILTTSYWVDYKSQQVLQFVRGYRAKYSFEPTEYSFKGYDEGFYFGSLMAKYGENFTSFLTKEKYKGLHNSFDFAFHPQQGYYNTQLFLLQYKNIALTVVD